MAETVFDDLDTGQTPAPKESAGTVFDDVPAAGSPSKKKRTPIAITPGFDEQHPIQNLLMKPLEAIGYKRLKTASDFLTKPRIPESFARNTMIGLEHVVPQDSKIGKSIPGKVFRGTVKGATNAVQGLSSIENVSMMLALPLRAAGWVAKGIATGAFSIEALNDIKNKAPEAWAKLKSGDYEGFTEDAVNLGFDIAVVGGAAKSTVKGFRSASEWKRPESMREVRVNAEDIRPDTRKLPGYGAPRALPPGPTTIPQEEKKGKYVGAPGGTVMMGNKEYTINADGTATEVIRARGSAGLLGEVPTRPVGTNMPPTRPQVKTQPKQLKGLPETAPEQYVGKPIEGEEGGMQPRGETTILPVREPINRRVEKPTWRKKVNERIRPRKASEIRPPVRPENRLPAGMDYHRLPETPELKGYHPDTLENICSRVSYRMHEIQDVLSQGTSQTLGGETGTLLRMSPEEEARGNYDSSKKGQPGVVGVIPGIKGSLLKTVGDASPQRCAEVIKNRSGKSGLYKTILAEVTDQVLKDEKPEIDAYEKEARQRDEDRRYLEEERKGIQGDIPKETVFDDAFQEKAAPKKIGKRAGEDLYYDDETGKSFTVKEGESVEDATKAHRAGQDFTLYGTFIPGLDIFIEKDLIPAAKKIVEGATECARGVRNLFDPKSKAPKAGVDALFQMKGGRDKAMFLLQSRFEAVKKKFAKMPEADQVDFIDRFKRGQRQATPELDQIARQYQAIEDQVYREVARYKPTLPYKQHHYTVLWKTVPGMAGESGFKGIFRRPLQGSKTSFHQSTLNDMSEGLARGGVPWSYNPQTMLEMAVADNMKFVTAQKMWEKIGDLNCREFVPFSKAPNNSGFVRLNDSIANVYFKAPEGMVEAGHWYVEPGVGRMLNNYLSGDWWRETVVGKGIVGFKNTTTAFELGFSAFHATFEGLESVGSETAQGLRKIWNLGVLQRRPGAIKEGLVDVAMSVTAPIKGVKGSTYRRGSQIIRYVKNPEEFRRTAEGRELAAEHPELDQLIDDMFTGGAQLELHADYKLNAIEGFQKAVADKNYLGAGLRAPLALNNKMMQPLFETFIPTLKVGMFAKEFSLGLMENEAKLRSGQMTRAELARKTWGFVEDRLGEMNFDNLWWNRTFKTTLQILCRSVTWKLGNLRASLGALPEQIKEINSAIRDRRAPMIEPKMAWLMGMSLWTAVAGTIIQEAYTGMKPQNLKDVVYPRIDKNDETQRFSTPTYWKDFLSLHHDWKRYITGSMSSELSKTMEWLENKDFYGTEIIDDSDPYYKQMQDGLAHFFPTPFSISSLKRLGEQGEGLSRQVPGFMGLTKAPAYITQSSATIQSREMVKRLLPQGARLKSESVRSKKRAELARLMNDNPEAYDAALDEALDKGEVSRRDVSLIEKRSQIPEVVRNMKRLNVRDAINIYTQEATPEEKDALREVIEKKLNTPTFQRLPIGQRNRLRKALIESGGWDDLEQDIEPEEDEHETDPNRG